MSIEWTEESLLALVGQEENYLLECKSGRLLEENSEKIGEDLSRAVSGFANAQGGTIVIGLTEDRRGKVRIIGKPDGVDGDWPTDRLQRLVESNVEPRVRVRFSRVPVPSAGLGRILATPAGIGASGASRRKPASAFSGERAHSCGNAGAPARSARSEHAGRRSLNPVTAHEFGIARAAPMQAMCV